MNKYETFDEQTILCIELATPKGNLLVYGTIIGVYGNRNADFMNEVKAQVQDWDSLCLDGKNICIAGDYNLSFSDSYYFRTDGRTAVADCFNRNAIRILTRDATDCIDHISVSDAFVSVGCESSVFEWNVDKNLSDHKGILVDF